MRSLKVGGMLLVGCLLGGGVASAQDTVPGFALGLRGGVAIVTQDVVDTIGAEGGASGGLDLLYGVTEQVVVGLSVTGSGTHVDDLTFGSTSVGSDLSIGTILGIVEYHFPAGRFAPYVVAGVGASYVSFSTASLTDALCSSLFGTSCELEGDTVFAAKIGGGVQYFITPHFAFTSEAGWIYNDKARTSFEVGGVQQGTRDLKLSLLSTVVGFRYYF